MRQEKETKYTEKRRDLTWAQLHKERKSPVKTEATGTEAKLYFGSAVLGADAALEISLLAVRDYPWLHSMTEFRWQVAVIGAIAGIWVYERYSDRVSRGLDKLFGVPLDKSKPQR